MPEPSPEAHSFVVKIWEKEVEDPRRDSSWRGSITHVGTGERQYFESLMHVSGFLAPYALDLAESLDFRTRLCLWICPSLARQETRRR